MAVQKALKPVQREGKIVIYKCPVCGRKHRDDPEFGPFCCASCLQVVIRPLIVALKGVKL
jgi:rubrerythrin